MSKAIIVAPWANTEAPTFTPAVIAANGDVTPGYSYIGVAPRRSGLDSAVLWIDASDACIAAIKADEINYVFVEDLEPPVVEEPVP